ncbi:MAG: TetR/AcrR family transcriptional regulator [Actinomycetota bacterium]
MARPREFDEAQVIDRARNAFWSNGVAATSISALSKATGLSVGSIYKAFASKDKLCSLTLEDYLLSGQADLRATVAEAETPWAGIRTWLDAIVDRAADSSPTRGCYGVALAIERAAVDDDVRAQLVAHDDELRRIVTEAANHAIEAGELQGDPAGVARLVCTTVNGLQVESRKGIERADAQRTIDLMLLAFAPR